MKMKLAHYLFQRVTQCGAEYTFGIPGDFVLPLYAELDQYGMKTIVCAHEPGCVYAADAYSRLRGLGVVLTTFGVGGLNMINPVAMAYAEHSPVVVISGAPALEGRMDNPVFHHLVKDYQSQQRVYEEVTCTTAALTEPHNAASEIDRVLDACLTLKRPGYIEIPRDMTSIQIPVPAEPARCYTGPSLDMTAMEEAANEIIVAFETSKNPVLYIGVGIRRYGLIEAACKIAETWGIPVISSVMGKASFPESHPNYVGAYMGEMGDEQCRTMIDNADLVLAAGVIFSDVNTGFWTSKITADHLIDIQDLKVKISHHVYQRVPMSSLLPHLGDQQPKPKQLPAFGRHQEPIAPELNQQKLSIVQLIRSLKKLDQARFSFLADIGDAWFAGLEIDADIFLAPGYYASMGFAVPGAVGAALAAPERRPIALVGDGAFQMTGNELSTIVANKLNPIIIILNNAYYKMLSALDGHRDYYNLNNWDYVKYAQALGCNGARARTASELDSCIEQAVAINQTFLIEAILQKEDHAPIMRRIKEYLEKTSQINVKKRQTD